MVVSLFIFELLVVAFAQGNFAAALTSPRLRRLRGEVGALLRAG
jgi:hypothetical protein